MQLDTRENASIPTVLDRAYVFGVATTATGAAFTRVARGEAELVESVADGQLQAITVRHAIRISEAEYARLTHGG